MSISNKPVFIIDAAEQARFSSAFWYEIWAYRDAFIVLVLRMIKVRYKQTVVGVAWILIRPLILMTILTLVFSQLAGLQSTGNAPYPLLVLAAVLFWQFFSSVFIEAGNSLVSNAGIIGKVYFPRILFPASTVVAGLLDLSITLLLFIPLMLWFDFYPGWQIVFLPLFLLLGVLLSLGAGLWFSALNVRYRDFQVIAPFVVQVGFFASPVGYLAENVPEPLLKFYNLNPFVGIIEGIRWSLLNGDATLSASAVYLSVVFALVMFLSGLRYFHRAEQAFADVI